LAALAVALAACDSATTAAQPAPVQAVTVSDLPAAPAAGHDPNTGQPPGTAGHFTLFSLRENETVADSASTAWDLGFRGTEIIVNGGVSGPGEGAAQVWAGSFGDLAEAPADGYAADSEDGNAIPTGSGNGWYSYDQATNLVTP